MFRVKPILLANVVKLKPRVGEVGCYFTERIDTSTLHFFVRRVPKRYFRSTLRIRYLNIVTT